MYQMVAHLLLDPVQRTPRNVLRIVLADYSLWTDLLRAVITSSQLQDSDILDVLSGIDPSPMTLNFILERVSSPVRESLYQLYLRKGDYQRLSHFIPYRNYFTMLADILPNIPYQDFADWYLERLVIGTKEDLQIALDLAKAKSAQSDIIQLLQGMYDHYDDPDKLDERELYIDQYYQNEDW